MNSPRWPFSRSRARTSAAALVLIATCLAALLLSGCASTGGSPTHGEAPDAGLYAWVDDELAPYLVDQLSRHPRFKNEPVVLVSMSGADMSPDIDALTVTSAPV